MAEGMGLAFRSSFGDNGFLSRSTAMLVTDAKRAFTILSVLFFSRVDQSLGRVRIASGRPNPGVLSHY